MTDRSEAQTTTESGIEITIERNDFSGQWGATYRLPSEDTSHTGFFSSGVIAIRYARLNISRWFNANEPDEGDIETWLSSDEGAEALDGCWVEPDGYCPHGHPSWLLSLGWL